MKMAASIALADLTQKEIPEDIKAYLCEAYPEDAEIKLFDGENPLKPDYVIPKPFDPRVVPHVAKAVAKAAMETGVARIKIDDLEKYEQDLLKRIKS